MSDRRDFLSSLSTAGVLLTCPQILSPNRANALTVEATPTVFFAPPDGRRVLVRFAVRGVDAPAGRLRVFDRSRSLLGTAGVIRSGETLLGELWLPLANTTSVVSELEAPGVRGPFRTTHRLELPRRWSLHVITVADAATVAAELSTLGPINRAVRTAIHRDQSVTINPLSCSDDIALLDHVPFLRLTETALNVELDHALPMGTAAYCHMGQALPKTLPLALAGSGIRILARENSDGDPFEWWEVPDGSRVLVVSVPPGSTPTALGFGLPADQMDRRVEEWLTQSAFLVTADEDTGTAVVVNTVADETLQATLSSISSWNARYAYPRIFVGNSAALFQQLESRATDGTATGSSYILTAGGSWVGDPSAIASKRSLQSDRRSQDMVNTLAETTLRGLRSLNELAPYVNAALPGTLVFNPSPYARTGLVRMTDGSERMATNVPGIGYAHFADERDGDHPSWMPVGSGRTIEGQRFRVSIDSSTGSIASLTQLDDGREWVQRDSGGLNSLPGTRLQGVRVERIPGVASRLIVQRRAASVGTVTTTVTAYDDLAWLDISNATESMSQHEPVYFFPFAMREPEISWEIPAGTDSAPLPIDHSSHLRWIRLADGDATLLFRGLDAPVFSVSTDRTLTSHAPRGHSRYRLASVIENASVDSPWLFGWETEPFVLARAEPNGLGTLPNFGSLFAVEKVGVTVLGVGPARLPNAATMYLQEILGVSREVFVGPGVLGFRRATGIDYLEREQGVLPLSADGTLMLSLPANGVVAVRLEELEVRQP